MMDGWTPRVVIMDHRGDVVMMVLRSTVETRSWCVVIVTELPLLE